MRINYDKRFKYSVPGFFFSYSVIVGAKLLWSIDHGENVLGAKRQREKMVCDACSLKSCSDVIFFVTGSPNLKNNHKNTATSELLWFPKSGIGRLGAKRLRIDMGVVFRPIYIIS